MKAQSVVTPRLAADMGLKVDHFRIARPRENGDAEMQACFSKLKELVPTVPVDKKLSKCALLQHVIDYILDLELTLETGPVVMAPAPVPQAAQVVRRPLAESRHFNTLQQMEVEDGGLSGAVSC